MSSTEKRRVPGLDRCQRLVRRQRTKALRERTRYHRRIGVQHQREQVVEGNGRIAIDAVLQIDEVAIVCRQFGHERFDPPRRLVFSDFRQQHRLVRVDVHIGIFLDLLLERAMLGADEQIADGQSLVMIHVVLTVVVEHVHVLVGIPVIEGIADLK